jgi:hypothetical protein
LGDFKNMVLNLREATSSNPSGRARKLVNGIISGFEERMNVDLDVKGAFDCLFHVISKLDRLRKQGKLGFQYAKAALEALEQVDRVLKIIY